MPTLESSIPHRLGRRTNFIPPIEGRPGTWPDLIDTAADPKRCRDVAESAVATILTSGPAGESLIETANIEALRDLAPDDMFAVRRPASHQGMSNYLSRIVVPSECHDVRAVWCESFNEQEHLRDLLLTRSPAQVSTQCLRLEWVLPSGVRSHVPDFLLRWGKRNTMVDITTQTKFDDPRLLAILRLTRATCAALGWAYQVRTELPPQRTRNVNFLRACSRDIGQDRVTSTRALRQSIGPVDVQRASEILGGGAHGYARLWDLLAHSHVFLDLDEPIDRDTPIAFIRQEGGKSWLRAL